MRAPSYKHSENYPFIRQQAQLNMRGSRKNFLRGGPNSQKGNFNMAKTNNLAIPGGGGGGPDPLSPPLDPPMLILVVRPQSQNYSQQKYF